MKPQDYSDITMTTCILLFLFCALVVWGPNGAWIWVLGVGLLVALIAGALWLIGGACEE